MEGTVEERLAALEHLVNDVLIGGLKKANDEYIDEDNYNKFTANYGEMLAPYVEPMKAICGDEYDLPRDLYDFTKQQEGYGTEGFDEKSIIDNAIESIKSKIAAIKGVSEDQVDVKVEANVDTADTDAAETKVETKVEEPVEKLDIDEDEEDEEEMDIPSEEELREEFARIKGN